MAGGSKAGGGEVFVGVGSKAQMEAKTDADVRDQWFNTDRNQIFWWDGDVWMADGLEKYVNRAGISLDYGRVVTLGSTTNGVLRSTGQLNTDAFGFTYTGGVDDAFVTIATGGKWKALCNSNTVIGDPMGTSGSSVGVLTFRSSYEVGVLARACETNSDGGTRLLDFSFIKGRVG